MTHTLKAPFPFFGGKSRIADIVWQRFGKPANYVEPFFGSGAVLLGCPWPGHTETVNDADGLLANFWRALRADTESVAYYADWPVNEADLHARHRWLVDRRSMVEELMSDPEWYDARAAGWWVWGISQWIGTGWCLRSPAAVADVGELTRKLPHVGDGGRGIRGTMDAHAGLPAQLPMLHGDSGASGRGVHAKRLSTQLPHVGNAGRGGYRASVLDRKMPFVASPSPDRPQHGLGIHGITYAGEGALYEYLQTLSARLRRTRVVCGDFARILGPSVTWRHGLTAVFLDPPYADDQHAIAYAGGGNVWGRVTQWCVESGDNPLLRVALCGYEDTWTPPNGWQAVKWRAHGGYGVQGNGRGRENAAREVVWFSPYCLDLDALPIFAAIKTGKEAT